MYKKFALTINSYGQSLVELLVALGVLSALLTIASISVTTSLYNAGQSKNQNEASLYAQQGIEIVRQIRDSGWNNFSLLSGNYCLDKSCTYLTDSGICGHKSGPSCGNNAGSFSREVSIIKNDSGCNAGGVDSSKVIVEVSWIDSKCTVANNYCRKVKVETCLSNIYGNSGL